MKPKLTTIEDIISDEIFRQNVKTVLAEVVEKRKNRPTPEPGRHYKRDWYDRMPWCNRNHEYFIKQIPLIWSKVSDLSSNERMVIEYVCNKALDRTIVHYEQQDTTDTDSTVLDATMQTEAATTETDSNDVD